MNKKEKKALPVLDQAIIEIGEFLTTTSNALKDKKLTFKETIDIAQEGWDLKIIYKEWDKIQEEWKNKSYEDMERWRELFIDHFELPYELAEERLRLGMKIIVLFMQFYDTF